MKTLTSKKQKGFSLLELLLVVGVGALLLLAGLATYRLVTEGNSVNQAIQLLNVIKAQTQNTFQNQGSYDIGTNDADLVPILIAANAFPAGVVNGAGVPQDSWGQPIQVQQDGADGVTFTITMNNVPQAACLKLGLAFDPTVDLDVESADIAGLALDSTTAPDLAGLSANCTPGTTNTLTWDFY